MAKLILFGLFDQAAMNDPRTFPGKPLIHNTYQQRRLLQDNWDATIVSTRTNCRMGMYVVLDPVPAGYAQKDIDAAVDAPANDAFKELCGGKYWSEILI